MNNSHSPDPDKKVGAVCRHDDKKWYELPLGGVITEPGNSRQYDTGNWVGSCAKWKKENCINCNLCWTVCPDEAILTDEEGNMIGVDAEKCKACGLCVDACPTNPKSLEIVKKEKEEI